jgi:hypothetical protein
LAKPATSSSPPLRIVAELSNPPEETISSPPLWIVVLSASPADRMPSVMPLETVKPLSVAPEPIS